MMNSELPITLKIPQDRHEIARSIVSNVEEIVNSVSDEHLEMLAKLPKKPEVSQAEKALAKKIAGEDYRERSSKELWCLEFGNLLSVYRLRRRLLRGAIDIEGVMDLLELDSQEQVLERIGNCTLLAVKDLGVDKFPVCQFDPEGEWGVINGLPEVLSALDVSSLRQLNWLTKVHRAFEGRTPLEMLLLGNLSDVLIEARAVGVGW